MNEIVLTAKQLAERWQLSLAKVYEDNNAGKLPQLPTSRNRFPLVAIEEIERETIFDRNNVRTPKERKLERELAEKEKQLQLKEEEIQMLKSAIAKVQAFTTGLVFKMVDEG